MQICLLIIHIWHTFPAFSYLKHFPHFLILNISRISWLKHFPHFHIFSTFCLEIIHISHFPSETLFPAFSSLRHFLQQTFKNSFLAFSSKNTFPAFYVHCQHFPLCSYTVQVVTVTQTQQIRIRPAARAGSVHSARLIYFVSWVFKKRKHEVFHKKNFNVWFQCLPPGCNCDPQAADPNSFCPAGEVCKVGHPIPTYMLYIS